jgi:hypothetical protein
MGYLQRLAGAKSFDLGKVGGRRFNRAASAAW